MRIYHKNRRKLENVSPNSRSRPGGRRFEQGLATKRHLNEFEKIRTSILGASVCVTARNRTRISVHDTQPCTVHNLATHRICVCAPKRFTGLFTISRLRSHHKFFQTAAIEWRAAGECLSSVRPVISSRSNHMILAKDSFSTSSKRSNRFPNRSQLDLFF